LKVFLIIMGAVIVLLAAGLLTVGPGVLTGTASPSGSGDDGGGFSFSFGSKSAGTQVRTEPVATRTLVETVPARGVIEPHTEVNISAQVVSEIVALPFREGEEVKKGDVVVKLDDADLLARLESARASLASANANHTAVKASRDRSKSSLEELQERRSGLLTTLDFAQRNLGRKQGLYDSGDIPMSELDQALERVRDVESQISQLDQTISGAESSLAQADAEILRAEAAIKGAEAEIKLAEEGLRNTTIVSPIDGKVVLLNAEVGETVMTGTMNNPGTVIMTIADLSRMRMVAKVDESDVAPVRIGQTARVYVNSYDETVFTGVVDRIALQMTRELDGSGFFETEILLRLDGREIYSGGNCNAEIEIAEHEGLVVPSQAVVDRDIEDMDDAVIDGSDLIDRSKRIIRVVYTLVDGKAIATPVKVGPSDETHTLVLEGLEEGDLVISGPYKVLDTIKHNEVVNTKSADEE